MVFILGLFTKVIAPVVSGSYTSRCQAGSLILQHLIDFLYGA